MTEGKKNGTNYNAIAGVLVLMVAFLGLVLGFKALSCWSNKKEAPMNDGNATYGRCVNDCAAGHDGNDSAVYKPGTPYRQPECWCGPKEGGFYEMMW